MEPPHPVPKSRKLPPTMENTRLPVPAPRRTVRTSQEAPLDEPINRRPDVSSSRELYEKFQEGKRLSKDLAILTKDKIEKGVLSVAKIAGKVVEQGMPSRRTGIRNEINMDVSHNQPDPTTIEKSMSHSSDMALFGKIRFNFPINDEQRNNASMPDNMFENATNPNTDSLTNQKNTDVEYKSNTSSPVPNINFNSSDVSACDNVDDNIVYEVISGTSRPVASLARSSVFASSTFGAHNKCNPIYEDVIPARVFDSPPQNMPKPKERPSNSTILEFDPLFASALVKSDIKSNSKEMLMIESLLGDTYNTVSRDDDVSDEVEFDFFMENSKYYNMLPPPPPERFDSLVEGVDKSPSVHEEPSAGQNSQWSFNNAASQKKKSTADKRESNTTIIKRFSTILKVVPDTASQIKKKFEGTSKVDKPHLSKGTVQHRGHMTRLLAGPIDELFRNYQMRLCVLSNQTITCYTDSKVTNSKETYNLENLFSLQIIFSSKEETSSLQCFQLNFHNPGGFTSTRSSVIFGCHNKMERSNWILKIVESLTNVFLPKYVSSMTRFGWCFIKENVSRPWNSGWLLLYQRKVFFHYAQDGAVHCLDLRKARCIVLQKDEDNNSVNAEDGPNLSLFFHDKTLHMKMGNATETKIWRKIIYSAATFNGVWLYSQQLTNDDVPILVNKCINFIYSEGSLSDGIYRKVGSVSSVKAILDAFKKDAWAVQLSPRTHTEYDVASALKQFFRDLPEPVLSPEIHEELYRTADLETKDEKVKAYREILKKLHPISQNTLRKLFGHLYFIQTLSNKNKMHSENLAAIWSPTLLSQHDASQQSFIRDAQVVRDLIESYIPIYELSTSELDREKLMLVVMQKYQKNNVPIPMKPSGDFHIWIYIESKSSGNSKNIMLSPGKTARELCIEHSAKMKTEPEELIVEEVICGESMYRPIHHSEILLEVVFRWVHWDECDRKDNYLVITRNKIVRESADMIELPISQQYFIGELKFASTKSKTFKNCTFHFNQGELSCYKDKLGNVLLDKWVANEIFWYIGHEPRRNPQTKWSLTIIRKNKTVRAKDTPWFGNILGGLADSDLKQLIGLFLHTEYPNEIFAIA